MKPKASPGGQDKINANKASFGVKKQSQDPRMKPNTKNMYLT